MSHRMVELLEAAKKSLVAAFSVGDQLDDRASKPLESLREALALALQSSKFPDGEAPVDSEEPWVLGDWRRIDQQLSTYELIVDSGETQFVAMTYFCDSLSCWKLIVKVNASIFHCSEHVERTQAVHAARLAIQRAWEIRKKAA